MTPNPRPFACVLVLAACLAGAAVVDAAPQAGELDRVFTRLYSYDFAGAQALLDQETSARPADPLVYAVRGAAHLFAEFDRQHVLEFAFFENDDKVTDQKKLKPDPAVRERLFGTTAQAKKLGLARLETDPYDRNALFAVLMAQSTEADYVGFIEKRYFRTYLASRETQRYARRALALDPPIYDAYLTVGAAEYIVGSLNFFFRLFVRLDKIEGDKKKAISDLEIVVEKGRYYGPFAKILMAAVHLREKRPQQALTLLRELNAEFPDNPLFPKEIARAEEKARLASATKR